MIVYTSRYDYCGSDRLDITRKGNVERAFMPTWSMIRDHKNKIISDSDYIERYYKLMRWSYKKYRSRWDDILNSERVTLVCFCKAGHFCHRYILKDILVKLGATYGGEI